MAQFKRSLFATSYFGKSYAFYGEYYTRVIDVGSPFKGVVDVSLKVELPYKTYEPKNGDIYSYPDSWKLEDNLLVSSSNETLHAFICGDLIELTFDELSSGDVEVVVKDDDKEVLSSTTINTTTTKELKLDFSFGNHWLEITPVSESNQIVFKDIHARVATIMAEIYTNDRYLSQDPNDVPNKKEVLFTDILRPDEDGWIHGISEEIDSFQEAISLKLYLATGDTDADTSPVVDTIRISSGDIEKYTGSGSWQVAINMNNVAAEEGVEFSRTKRIDFQAGGKTSITSNENWMEEYLQIRSAGKNLTQANDATIPTDLEVRGSYYWSPETATYRKYHNTVVPRISLGHNNNNGFTENKEYAQVVFGPFSKETMPYINTTLMDWSQLMAAFSFPTDTRGTYFKIQVYDTNKINTYLPVYEKTITKDTMNTSIPLDMAQLFEEIYIGVVFYSRIDTQSPVLDSTRLLYHLEYNKIINYKDKVSGLDNMYSEHKLPAAPDGTKLLRHINTNDFEVPGNSIEKSYTILFTPKYPNQQFVYFGNDKGIELSNSLVVGDEPSLRIYSRVIPDVPRASVFEVPEDRLYWHYQYDGGSVSYPHIVQKELNTDFTPSLIQPKDYKFTVLNGWPSESIALPQSMTWLEIAEISGSSVEVIKELNPNIILYNNLIQRDTIINLENTSENDSVSLTFKSNNRLVTELSVWNERPENDFVVARVTGNIESELDWVSEERIFAGVINPNNEAHSYIRTQSLGLGGDTSGSIVTNRGSESKSYQSISEEHNVSLADLLLANNLLSDYRNADEVYVRPGESYVLPAQPSLPDLPSNVFYEKDNPYVIEIIPGSLRKTYDNIPVLEEHLIPGSDDEPAIQYTMTESEEREHILTRGQFAHGRETLPYPNINRIIQIRNNVTGVVYTPYNGEGNSEIGDYYLDNGMVSWEPDHVGSKEPKTGETYTVRFTNNIVDTLKIIYTTNYYEKLSYNKLWRSKDIKIVEGIVSPDKDIYLDLPSYESYSDYRAYIEKPDYVIEDSDLWVKSSLVKTEEGRKIRLSFDGKDPKRNWFPTINKGFYYINDQEYYLYSEPIKQHFGEEQIPVIESVHYDRNGLRMKESESKEHIKNSLFRESELESWSYNMDRVKLHQNAREGNYVSIQSSTPGIESYSINQTVNSVGEDAVVSVKLRSGSAGTALIVIGDIEKEITNIPAEWQVYQFGLDTSFDESVEVSIGTNTQIDINYFSIQS